MSLFDVFGTGDASPPPAPAGPRSRAADLTPDWFPPADYPPFESVPEDSAASLLDGLNDRQAEAVVHSGGPLLIIAGAGSGKTRVLTHRIAHLLATGRATAGEILAITFTNKAAAEMRERVSALVGPHARRIWVSTFHSACVRILREHHEAAGLKSTFSIYDQQDSQRLLGMILRDQEIDSKRFTARLLSMKISDLKNELITPEQYAAQAPGDPLSQIVAATYTEYQKRLRQANAVDFDDIIMVTVQMLQAHPAVAEYYQRRFRHILVDEYQDTNHAQYVLVRTLVGGRGGELTVVGDSDQSIYAFRGATIRNIEEFEKDYPDATTVLLEQNYRSTQNILSAANAVISGNPGRRAKNLWTALGSGERITLDAADSEYDEARLIVRELDDLAADGAQWGDVAIFYRTNAQSRAIEEMLLRSGIPYRIVGGTRFYERQEIKDALAYLQAISNPDDTVALRRIINTPRRGIGARAEAAIMAHADRYGLSLGEALADAAEHSPRPIEGIAARARKSVAEFWNLLADMRAADAQGESAGTILDEVLARSGYLATLQASADPQDASRVDNLAELLSVAEDFEATRRAYLAADEPDTRVDETGGLGAFLERVALVADADQIPTEGDGTGEVTLMTVHTAKGLEFPHVFVTGMEDGTFPHRRSLDDPAELAEERRLAYVAITRARERLYLTRAASRSAWGKPEALAPSRFLDHLPEEVVRRRHEASREQLLGTVGRIFGSGAPGSLTRSSVSSQPATRGSAGGGKGGSRLLGGGDDKPVLVLALGDEVQHGTLGRGTVISVEGTGRQTVAKIDFDGTVKRLLVRMAPLKKLSPGQ